MGGVKAPAYTARIDTFSCAGASSGLYFTMLRFIRLLPLVSVLFAPLCGQNGDKRGEEQKAVPSYIKVPPAPVRTAEQELATFKLVPGFHAELIAADPVV